MLKWIYRSGVSKQFFRPAEVGLANGNIPAPAAGEQSRHPGLRLACGWGHRASRGCPSKSAWIIYDALTLAPATAAVATAVTSTAAAVTATASVAVVDAVAVVVVVVVFVVVVVAVAAAVAAAAAVAVVVVVVVVAAAAAVAAVKRCC